MTVLVAMACLASRTLTAVEVVVVLSSEAAPYVQAGQAVLAHLPEDASARLVQLVEVQTGDATAVLGEDRLLVAVGAAATAFLHERVDAQRPVLCCMIRRSQQGAIIRAATRHAVPLDVPVRVQVAQIERALPRARRLGTLVDADDPASLGLVEAFAAALPAHCELVRVDVDRYASKAAAIQALLALEPDLVWTAADAAVYNGAVVKALLQRTLSHRVPVYGFSQAFVQAGALMGSGIDPADQGRQIAGLCRRLQAGEPVGDEAPVVDFFLNAIVADKIAVRLPQAAIDAADEVIGRVR